MRRSGHAALAAAILIVIGVFVGGCSNQDMVSGDLWDSLKTDLGRLPGQVVEDSKDSFLRRDSALLLMGAGAASIAMNQGADKDIESSIDDHQQIDGFGGEALNIVGGPGFHFGMTGLWYALAVENGDELNKHRAWTMMRALSTTGFWTVGLKTARGNHTPNGKDWAWPSGHTSSSFAVASVLDEFYGPGVGIPAYGVASLVAYRMVDEGDHWTSDVIFGAALGWVVGHNVAGKGKDLEIAGFKVMPFVTGDGRVATGVSLFKRF